MMMTFPIVIYEGMTQFLVLKNAPLLMLYRQFLGYNNTHISASITGEQGHIQIWKNDIYTSTLSIKS